MGVCDIINTVAKSIFGGADSENQIKSKKTKISTKQKPVPSNTASEKETLDSGVIKGAKIFKTKVEDVCVVYCFVHTYNMFPLDSVRSVIRLRRYS